MVHDILFKCGTYILTCEIFYTFSWIVYESPPEPLYIHIVHCHYISHLLHYIAEHRIVRCDKNVKINRSIIVIKHDINLISFIVLWLVLKNKVLEEGFKFITCLHVSDYFIIYRNIIQQA